MKPLKIAVISKSDGDGGGAGRIAEQLASRLNARDDVVVHHWKGYAPSRHDREKQLYGPLSTRLPWQTCHTLSGLVGLPDFLTPEALLFAWRQRKFEYDLIHFHDISATFSPIGMRWLSRYKPVVWTFHDCSPFTGGCINPLGCTAYQTRCGHCPRLGTWPLDTRIDLTGFMQAYKRRTARLGLFTPIAPSHWIAKESVKAGFFDEPPVVIPNAVDSDRFKPLERRNIRHILGLNQDKFTVLLAAGHLGDPFKGTEHAIAALNRMEKDIQVIFVGTPDEELIAGCGASEKHVAGRIGHDRLLAQYFAAADVYLYPTVADNLPNTVLETMACGTPTVGFRTGGMPDMIEQGENGHLVEPGDVDGLVAGLKTVAENPALRHHWGLAARHRACTVFGYDRFIEDTLRLYEGVIAGEKINSENTSERSSGSERSSAAA